MNYLDAVKSFQPRNEQEAADQQVILGYIHNHGDALLTRGNKIAHITSSGLILNKSLDKMLMVHHNIYNTWAWTGGHADGEPDLLEVAMKEGKEETGVLELKPFSEQVASLDILPVYGHFKRGEYVSSHLHLNAAYVLIADEGETLHVNADENSGVAWVRVDELGEYSNEPDLIDVYLKIVKWARRR